MAMKSDPRNDFREISSPSSKRPISIPIASAVAFVSPVIIMTRIPASRHLSIDSLTSGRGGSLIPTRPKKTISFSYFTYSSGGTLRRSCASPSISPLRIFFKASGMSVFIASASTRRGVEAISLFSSRIRSTSALFNLVSVPSSRSMRLHRVTTISGAPFTRRTFSSEPSKRARTLIDLRVLSNSSTAIFSIFFSKKVRTGKNAPRAASETFISSGKPIFSPKTTNAASVGTPRESSILSLVSEN
mmetsp:Transcript_17568/g.24575  ORF Transcript_17568/g.24575 Transcript_17568/m.24575 type:complete len:245 (-) Transcript_17568:423-1157(-)